MLNVDDKGEYDNVDEYNVDDLEDRIGLWVDFDQYATLQAIEHHIELLSSS